MTGIPTEEEAVAGLKDAIETWWKATYTNDEDGPSILRSWYLMAEGAFYDADGEQYTVVGQQYDADVIQQLGLVEYVRRRVTQRMGLSAEQEEDS